MEKLSVKQKRFCDEYLIDLNATQAAIRAGYKEKYAHTNAPKLLQNTTIKEYIDKRMAEKEDQLIAKQNEVLKYLTAVMRRELMEYVVVTVSEEHSYYAPDEDGKMRKRTDKTETPKVVPIPARLSDSNKGAELLGKRYRLFTDSVDMNGAIPVVITGEDELED
ncbi:terminase small subunit [Candidatus Proelusimicrobium excrementi]|uniref:terminase small subunit n=1 Tax=Candidatus Proelusimicrobium excrementi TaxID=3416222 RepID=UPI003CBECA1F|nr:terminase small subunit [Elusimicrobiaceae bacterium]MBR3927723.1 terminase small subunit [Clostridia bacterium]